MTPLFVAVFDHDALSFERQRRRGVPHLKGRECPLPRATDFRRRSPLCSFEQQRTHLEEKLADAAAQVALVRDGHEALKRQYVPISTSLPKTLM